MVDGKWTAALKRTPDAQAPAGGVSSNVKDLAQWLRLELANGKYDGKQLIKEDALLQTCQPLIIRGENPITGAPGFYGLGWNVDYQIDGTVYYDHAGAFTQGARTVVVMVPSEQLGIIVLSNAFPTGVPEGIAYTFLDYVNLGALAQDWVKTWNGLYDSLYGPTRIDAAAAVYATPPTPASPAKANSAYVGTYTNDYVGDAVVVEKDGALELQLGPTEKSVSVNAL